MLLLAAALALLFATWALAVLIVRSDRAAGALQRRLGDTGGLVAVLSLGCSGPLMALLLVA